MAGPEATAAGESPPPPSDPGSGDRSGAIQCGAQDGDGRRGLDVRRHCETGHVRARTELGFRACACEGFTAMIVCLQTPQKSIENRSCCWTDLHLDSG